jgi:antitoxin component YwqK of YwqJK toxin-antitoxin module
MKTILACLVLIVFSLAPDLRAQQEIVVLTGVSDEGYETRVRTGEVTDGTLEAQEALIDGTWTEHGRWTFTNDSKTWVTHYVRGYKHGDDVHRDHDGNITSSVKYVDGKKSGPCFMDMLSDFGFTVEGQYKNDLPSGTWFNKDESGNTINIIVYNEHGRMTYSSMLQSDGVREWEWIIVDWQPYYFKYRSTWTTYVIVFLSCFLVASVLVYRRRKRQIRLKSE